VPGSSSRDDLQCVSADRRLPISDGLEIAVREFKNPKANSYSVQMLGLHGWLDNAGSFELLARELVALNPQVWFVAVDLLGHGQSDHGRGPYQYLDQIEAIHDVLDALKWDTCFIVGHSYGGNNATLYAAALPGRIQGLVVWWFLYCVCCYHCSSATLVLLRLGSADDRKLGPSNN